MAMTDFKKVTRDEFVAFLHSYRGNLEYDCITFMDPPIHTYLDWAKATREIGTLNAYREARQAYYVNISEEDGEYWIRQ